MKPDFALNHMTVAPLSPSALIALASRLGCAAVEFRNDLPGANLTADRAACLGGEAGAANLRIAGLSEIKPFNHWSVDTDAQARALMDIAVRLGAEAVCLIPRCDGEEREPGVRNANLRIALRELVPLLEEFDLIGLVEPLGFERSSLRTKAEALDAIDGLSARGRIKLVHDTFHHHLAGESEFFPDDTGIVHVSGVEDAVPRERMEDTDRVLVGPADRLGTVAQVAALRDKGYRGPISFEVFSPKIQNLENPEDHLAASITFIERELGKAAGS